MDLRTLHDEARSSLVARLSMMLGGDRGAAEEIVQEALLRAWVHLPDGAGVDHQHRWLRRTAGNLAIDELRRRDRRPAISLDDLEEMASPQAPAHDSDDGRASEALAGLSAHERFVVLMRFDGGFSPAEIGAVLGIGEEAARKRVARARAAFVTGYRRLGAGVDPLILLVACDDDPAPYEWWLRGAGARVRRVERDLTERDIATADGIVFTGAAVDLDSRLYGETPRHVQGVLDLRRDRRDLAAMRTALAHDLPILGVCRGGQLLNIASGGTLYQDVVADGLTAVAHDVSDHSVRTESGALARRVLGRSATVHSTHHQAVRRLGRGLRVSASSPDGVIETIERADRRFALGTQWHPEQTETPVGDRVAEALVCAARATAA